MIVTARQSCNTLLQLKSSVSKRLNEQNLTIYWIVKRVRTCEAATIAAHADSDAMPEDLGGIGGRDRVSPIGPIVGSLSGGTGGRV